MVRPFEVTSVYSWVCERLKGVEWVQILVIFSEYTDWQLGTI
jgi:hypothetical protein